MSQNVMSVIAAFSDLLAFPLFTTSGDRDSGSRPSAALVFWAVYLVFLYFVDNEYLGFFVVAILITIYSEIWARILKTPATTILMPTVIPLIPGGSLYYAMDAALQLGGGWGFIVGKNKKQKGERCPFVRQYGILSNKWGVLLCQKEYQTNDIRRNSKNW